MIRSDADAIAVLREIEGIVARAFPLAEDARVEPGTAYIIAQIGALARSILSRLPEGTLQ